jgi:hypothetical protein
VVLLHREIPVVITGNGSAVWLQEYGYPIWLLQCLFTESANS